MALADDLHRQMRCHLTGLAIKGWRIEKLHFGHRLADIACGRITALSIACQEFWFAPYQEPDHQIALAHRRFRSGLPADAA